MASLEIKQDIYVVIKKQSSSADIYIQLGREGVSNAHWGISVVNHRIIENGITISDETIV